MKPRLLLAAALIALATLSFGSARADGESQAPIAARLSALAEQPRPVIEGDRLIAHIALSRLYAAPAHLYWQDAVRRAALFAAIRNSAGDGLTPSDYHLEALERLAARPGADSAVEFDLLATDAYVLLLYHLYLGKVDPLSIEPHWGLTLRTLNEQRALEFVHAALEDGTIAESVARVRPNHWLYAHGVATLARYRALAAAGGWPTLPAGGKLAPGGNDARVPTLRRRLAISGDYDGKDLDSTELDAALTEALRVFQRRHLLAADGALGAATLRELNVPVAARIQQLRINLERGRWVLHEIGPGDLVIVDIAGYGVRLLHDDKTLWRTRAIVGEPFRQTPVFRAEIERVVLNPTWTVPPGILEKDVLPGMQHGRNVLERNHLKVYRHDGSEVDLHSIDWSKWTARTFPYVLRQDAGDGNALGRVKIDFPNPYFVYLHDTPSRALFERDDRTFSHGCIRVEHPLELAERLLADPEHWNAAAINAAVEAGTTRYVNLAHKVPVLVMYWTADEDEDGRTVFKRDLYRRDARLGRALDGKFSVGSRARP